jgi:hypothetical protein
LTRFSEISVNPSTTMITAIGPAAGGPLAFLPGERFAIDTRSGEFSRNLQRASLKYRPLGPSLCVTSIPEGEIDEYRQGVACW